MVIIESILSHDHINGPSDKTAFFGANQSSIQFVEVSVRFETLRLAMSITADNEEFTPRMVLGTGPGNNGRPTDLTAIWISDISKAFREFRVGDTVQVVGAVTDSGVNNVTALITEILDDDRGTQTLITNHTFTAELVPVGAYVAVVTVQKSIEYLSNLIENQEVTNYESKIDGDTQRSIVGGLLYTDLVTEHIATMLGNQSWHFGSITVRGNGTGNGNTVLVSGVIQAFVITHELIVGPLTLFDEWDNNQNRIKPDRLLDGNSFKYINQIGISPQENNPNDIVVVDEDESLGNVGWFNENLNGKPNDYTFSSPVYKRADATINDSIELTTNEQTIEYSIFSTEGTFVNGSTKVIFGHNFAPSDQSQYRNIVAATSQTMEYNFVFDQVIETLGSGGVAVPRQEDLGITNLQVIKKMETVRISASQIDITVTLQMDVDVVSRINANPVRRYMIYTEVADPSLNRASTDKVQLLIDATDYFTDITDDGMIVMSQSFLRHPFSNTTTETETFISLFPEADFVGINDFFIDKLTREDDEIILTGITSEMILRKDTGASFVVDSKTKNLSAFPSVEVPTFGDIHNANFSEDRGFKTPVDDVRANWKLNRIYASDTGGKFFSKSSFPTRIHWNDYTALTGVNDEFFDDQQPNDGFNNDWIRYDAEPDWALYYKTTITALKNGDPLTYVEDTQVLTRDYQAGDEWNTEQIKAFDENGIELGFGITYANGKLQANFTFIGLTTPAVEDLEIDFHLYVFEQGTFKSIYTLSSAYDAHPDTLFKSIDTSNRTVITDEGGGVFRGEVLTDGIKIGALDKSEFQVSALIYDKRDAEPPPPPAVPKQKEDGTPKQQDGSTLFKIKE